MNLSTIRRWTGALAALLAISLPCAAHAAAPNFDRGPHEVGLMVTDFTKPSETTGQPRTLNTYIWYPAVANTGHAQGNALRDADVLSGRWPLIMFSHGSCGIPNQSPFYAEALASWGFIVAAPSHPGNTTFELSTCSQPAVLADSFANRPADIGYVASVLIGASRSEPDSPFYRRVDPDRLGMTGHSFGGQTTLRVAASDRRFDAAVALAPAVGEGLSTLDIEIPTMVMGAELDSLTPFETASRDAYALLRGPRFLVELLNTGHCAFAIACGESLCGNGCQPGTASLDETHHLTNRYAVPFFLTYLARSANDTSLLLPSAAPDGAVVVAAVPSSGRVPLLRSRLPGLRVR